MSFWELIIKGIPEGLLDVLGIYLLTKSKMILKNYLITSFIFIIIKFVLKNLLNMGVSTMISLLILVLISVIYNHIEITKTIKAILIVALVLFLCDFLNVLILFLIYGNKAGEFVGFKKAISSIPSTIIFSVSLFLYYFYSKKASIKKGIDEKVI
jgi:hypothetical protein